MGEALAQRAHTDSHEMSRRGSFASTLDGVSRRSRPKLVARKACKQDSAQLLVACAEQRQLTGAAASAALQRNK